MKAIPTIALLLLASCSTPRTGSVTLSSVVNDAEASYSKIYRDRPVSPDLAASIGQALLTFRQSCGVAQAALMAYKAGGTQASLDQYNLALNAERQSAQWYLSLLYPILPPQDAADFSTRLKNATEP